MKRQRGQSMLYTVILVPAVLILIAGMVIDIGGLQVQRSRLHWAVDLAALDASTEIDAPFYASTGRIRLDPAAAPAAFRVFLAENLATLPSSVAESPEQLAQAAEVAITDDVPASDPITGQTDEAPTISVRLPVPVTTGLLHLAGLPDTESLTVTASAEART
ncbi:MAG: TadE/TadG family type IV pilus assembly protein [Candidatus Dormibacteria bacterium]